MSVEVSLRSVSRAPPIAGAPPGTELSLEPANDSGVNRGGRKRLLIVDDDPAIFAVLRTHLIPLGYQIETAEDEQSALALFAATAPDLILLDLLMPGIGGLGILAQIRGEARGLYVPVIFMTAHSERALHLLALRSGADEFLEKPIDAPILLARVTSLLKLKESRDQLEAARDSLAIKNVMLEKVQREQRELTQFVVHDLKNQLFVVLMSLECGQAMVAELQSEEISAVLSEGMQGADRLRTMVEDLLTVSRLEEAFPVQTQKLCPGELLGQIIAVYQSKAKLNSITLTGPLDANWEMRADPALLRRVIENLLDNALRYTPSGARISVSAKRAEHIEIAVSNDGPVIPIDERDSIFEKFVRGRADSLTTGNSGLGLYFCKRTMEAHGGSISVHQTKEWPTSFVLHFLGAT
jgi:two-component system sensor histidine kinase/response regulator